MEDPDVAVPEIVVVDGTVAVNDDHLQQLQLAWSEEVEQILLSPAVDEEYGPKILQPCRSRERVMSLAVPADNAGGILLIHAPVSAFGNSSSDAASQHIPCD